MPLDIFEKDIIQLRRITNSKVNKIVLLGGEPLLNKNIKSYIKIARENFNNSHIFIITNGLLLNEMQEDFYKTCADYKITIQYSIYPLYKKYPNLEKAQKKAQKFNINLKGRWRKKKYKFSLVQLSTKKLNDKSVKYKECKNKIHYAQLDNGRLYPCPTIPGINIFNNYFKENAIPQSDNDYIDIYKIKTLQEIFDFLKTPKEACKYCNYGSKQAIWRPSERKISEWFDV